MVRQRSDKRSGPSGRCQAAARPGQKAASIEPGTALGPQPQPGCGRSGNGQTRLPGGFLNAACPLPDRPGRCLTVRLAANWLQTGSNLTCAPQCWLYSIASERILTGEPGSVLAESWLIDASWLIPARSPGFRQFPLPGSNLTESGAVLAHACDCLAVIWPCLSQPDPCLTPILTGFCSNS